MEEPDPDVIRSAAAGDLDALDRLIGDYQVPVWRFLTHFLHDATLAEDVTQETFVRVFRRVGSFGFESKFSTWVFSIARNAGIDALRTRDRRARLALVAPEPAPLEHPVAIAEVSAALAALVPIQREAIVAIEVLGLTYREAGLVLEVPEGTVKRRVHDARRALAAWSDDTGASGAGVRS